MLRLFKFSSSVSNWTRTMRSIKQHGTHYSSPIKYNALANYVGSNSSCLFSFCGQIWLKNEEKRLNSPSNRLDEEQLVVVSIFKCWSKNVYDDGHHHHHQEARSMSCSSSFVSLTNTFIHLASYSNKEKRREQEKKWDFSTIITRDLFPVHHHVIIIENFFFFRF